MHEACSECVDARLNGAQPLRLEGTHGEEAGHSKEDEMTTI